MSRFYDPERSMVAGELVGVVWIVKASSIADLRLRAIHISITALRIEGLMVTDEKIIRLVRAFGESDVGLERQLEEMRREEALARCA